MTMTMREVFNKVKAHLLAQNKRAVESSWAIKREPNCLYRAPDGTKCAAGCLIDDEHYSPELERKTTTAGPVVSALLKSGVPVEATEYSEKYPRTALVRALQLVHDDPDEGPEFWPTKLDKIERDYFGGAA